jgi:predicted Zn-ribbon and HTH transcriptional regulator
MIRAMLEDARCKHKAYYRVQDKAKGKKKKGVSLVLAMPDAEKVYYEYDAVVPKQPSRAGSSC